MQVQSIDAFADPKHISKALHSPHFGTHFVRKLYPVGSLRFMSDIIVVVPGMLLLWFVSTGSLQKTSSLAHPRLPKSGHKLRC